MTAQGKMPGRKTILVILDGFGLNPGKRNNAVYLADTPRLDEYLERYPHIALEASGNAVGVPAGQMGNSEVGHLTLGCGSILRQSLVYIDDAIRQGDFFRNEALLRACDLARKKRRPLHLVGLVSDGGVHSHIRHLMALINLAARRGVEPHVHVITDGRDASPGSGLRYIRRLSPLLEAAGGRIGTICGRFYAMDRDSRWDRTHAAWELLVRGNGRHAGTPEEAIQTAYASGESDEFIRPIRIKDAELVQGGDPVIFFNFRNDRPRQLARALGAHQFDGVDRGDFCPANVTTFTLYDEAHTGPIAFLPETPETTLAQVISEAGLRQFHCAETEKYAHVTFFFNGGREEAFPGEDRVLVPSPRVRTYDQAPAMNAKGVADKTIAALESDQYDFLVVNFANGDMVGHTGVKEAILAAVEAMDEQVGRVLDTAVARDYSVILTADHGNCDEMVDPLTGEPNTRHTIYPVPCMVIDPMPMRLTTGAGLSNIAPTVLELIGLNKPAAMKAMSLIISQEEQVA